MVKTLILHITITRVVCMEFLQGEEYTFTSMNGEDIRELVDMFLEGLRKKSKFVIAMMDYQSPGRPYLLRASLPCSQLQCLDTFSTLGEGSEFLSFRKGDLIVLSNEKGEDVMTSGWCYGECVRTQEKGDFPAECVYVLPTLRKPPAQVLVCCVCVCVCVCVCCLLYTSPSPRDATLSRMPSSA